MLNILVCLLIVTVIHPLDIQKTKISSIRDQTREAVCTYYKTNFTQVAKEQIQPLIQRYTYLTDEQVQAILYKQQLTYIPMDIILLVVPHAVCLLVLIIMWPGLCCCCMRPDKFPVCKICRKPPTQMYGKCQLKWPAYNALLVYMTILAGSVAAVYEGPNITNIFNNYGCRALAIADDTLNGRINPQKNDTFFVGLAPLQSQLVSFRSKLTTFYTETQTSLEDAYQIRNQQEYIQNNITLYYSSYNNKVYSNAFTQSNGVSYTPVTSAFKTMFYGPQTDQSKILGNIKSQLSVIFAELNTALDPMIKAWNVIQNNRIQKITELINKTIENITTHKQQLSATIKAYQFFDIPDILNNINIGFKTIYGVVIGLSALGLLATIVLACCTVVRARMIIYFTCSFLIFMGVITFAITIGLAYIMPNLAQICAYADRKLATSQGTEYLLKNLQFNETATLYKNCLSTSNGNILEDLAADYEPVFNALDLVSDYTLSFNEKIPTFASENFDKPFSESSTVLTEITESRVLEVQDTIAIQFLQALSRKGYTIDPVKCTDSANIKADSWVPSVDVISCSGGLFKQKPCSDLSDIVICPQGCYGIYEQLTSPAGDPSSYASNLQVRYGAGCNYANYIINLHDNWNLKRKAEMQIVQGDLDNLKTYVDTYDTSMKKIQASLSSFRENLQINFNSETNLTSGSFNGMDCRSLGQSIVQYRDSACVGLLSSVQYNFIMCSIISYSILILSCLSVCAGVRHYQHLQKMQSQVGYKGVPVAVSTKRIIDGFQQ